MTDNRQFGARPPRFGDPAQVSDTRACVQCEAMLADAIDRALSPEDQAIFESHIAHCGPCAQVYADARRGAAWLEMLRDPRPEPPAALLERILTQTSGIHTAVHTAETPGPTLLPAPPAPQYAPGYIPSPSLYSPAAHPVRLGTVLPFRTRFASAARSSAFGQIMLQPRLAMTAAMAFFSIVLTMNLAGVRMRDLHASDLSPSSLQRDFYSTNARVVQYYEGLRVVYELESRVHDLEATGNNDATAGSQATPLPASSDASPDPNPGSPNSSRPEPAQPPATQPAPANQHPSTHPRQPSPAPNSGTSRREDLPGTRRVVVAYNPIGQPERFTARAATVRGRGDLV